MAQITIGHDEQIISEIRQRVSSFIWHWVSSLLLLLAAAIGMFWFFRHGTWGIIGFVALLLSGLWGCMVTLVRARGTVLIITTSRIVDIVKDGLFGKTVSEVDLQDIEDVAVRQRGIWRMILKYGTLEIRIRDSKVKIVVDHVSRPMGIQRLINELRRQRSKDRFVQKNIESFEDVHKALTILSEEELIRVKKLIDEKIRQLRRD